MLQTPRNGSVHTGASQMADHDRRCIGADREERAVPDRELAIISG